MDASRIKYLELIQAVIARLAGHSFAIKSVAITVASGLIGFAAAEKNAKVLLVALIPVFAAWGLDAFYLQRERMFRALYEAARRETGEPSFLLDPNGWKSAVPGWVLTMLSRSLSGLYLPLLIVILLAWELS